MLSRILKKYLQLLKACFLMFFYFYHKPSLYHLLQKKRISFLRLSSRKKSLGSRIIFIFLFIPGFLVSEPLLLLCLPFLCLWIPLLKKVILFNSSVCLLALFSEKLGFLASYRKHHYYLLFSVEYHYLIVHKHFHKKS
jgi:hypothetical protein